MRPVALTVYLKELRDAARDRRTMLMLFFASILSGPVIMLLLAYYISGIEEKGSVLKVRIVGREHAPALVNFLNRMDVAIEDAPADYEARIREGRLDAVIVVPRDFDQKFLAGEGARVEIVYDDSRTENSPAIRQSQNLLRAFNREAGMLRLMARGVSPDLVEPVKVSQVNTATPRQRGAGILMFVAMMAMLSPLLGGMTIAIDSTAGERERGSLEPLLANPVEAGRLVLGKWLAAWTSGVLVSALTLTGFVMATTMYTGRMLSSLMSFGVPELAQFMLLLVPFAGLTSALQILICTYGRSYREAQTYVSYLTTIIAFVPMLVLFTGLKEAKWHLLVPFLGQQAMLTRIVRGEPLSGNDYLLPSLVALALGAVCVVAVSRLLREERIVFGRG